MDNDNIVIDNKSEQRETSSLPAIRLMADETSMAIEMPEPGSYYRLTPDYDVAGEERARKNHEDKIDSFEHQQKYMKKHPHYKMDEKSQRQHPGEFVAPALVAKTIMLVKEVRLVNGEFHSVTIADHPTGKFLGGDITADQFRAWFEEAPDWKEVRAKELNDAQRGLQESQDDLVKGPKREEVDPEPQSPLALSPAGAPTSFAIAVQNGGRESIESNAKRRMAIAVNTENWLTTNAAEMTKRVGIVAAFHQENAAAQIAKTQKIREEVSRLSRGIESLGIYSGDDVEVEQIMDGLSAPKDIPLVLFQRMLYMDEEFLIHTALHGADWKDMDDFHEALRTDSRLLNTLVPYQRCVILFKVRRDKVDYYPNIAEVNGAAWAMMNQEANKPNHRRFLLVRDGERLHHVWLPDEIGNAERLFPQKDELEKPFRGYNGTMLSFEDLAYHKAHEKSEDESLFYKRLLVLLWGLNDREQLFGSFYEPVTYPISGFLSLDFQHEHLLFVHDDDHVQALGDTRVQWKTWVPAMNAHLQPGSRVLCLWDRLITHATAPGMVDLRRNSQGYDREFKTVRIKENISIALCTMDKEGYPIVKSPVERGLREFQGTVNLAYAQSMDDDSEDCSFLVLDAVNAEDIETILASRADRKEYLTYIPLLTAARDAIIEQDLASKHAMNKLSEDLRAAKLVDTDAVQKIAYETTRTWQAAHKGQPLPEIDTKNGKVALNEMRAVAWKALYGEIDVANVAALVEKNRRKPIALVARGDGTFGIYATSTSEENYNAIIPWRWVAYAELTIKKSGIKINGSWSSQTLPLASAGERTLHLWEGAEAYRSSPFTLKNGNHEDDILTDPQLSLKRAKELASALQNAGENLQRLFAGTENIAATIADLRKKITFSRGSLNVTQEFFLPIAMLEVRMAEKDLTKDTFWIHNTEQQQEEKIRKYKEIIKKRGHIVAALIWNPFTPLLLAGGEAEQETVALWKRVLVDPDWQIKHYREKKPKIAIYQMDKIPASTYGVIDGKDFSESYNTIGPENLFGDEFSIDWSAHSSARLGYKMRPTFVADGVKDLILAHVAPKKPYLYEKRNK